MLAGDMTHTHSERESETETGTRKMDWCGHGQLCSWSAAHAVAKQYVAQTEAESFSAEAVQRQCPNESDEQLKWYTVCQKTTAHTRSWLGNWWTPAKREDQPPMSSHQCMSPLCVSLCVHCTRLWPIKTIHTAGYLLGVHVTIIACGCAPMREC